MTDASEPTQPGPAPALIQSTVSRKWTIRMALISLGLIAFGLWGLWDASVKYPQRGALAAAWMEYQYLGAYASARGGVDAGAGFADPVAERQRLEAVRNEKGELSAADKAKLDWIEALQLIGKDEGGTATAIPRTDFRGGPDAPVTDARSRLEALKRQFTTATGEKVEAPSALTQWDIPVQWLITAGGLGIGLYIVVLVVRVRSRVFRYDPATKRLTLPGGATFGPGDIEDLDKRKWHKFYVTVQFKPGHDTLGGKSVELDLLRYEPVEAWILEIEREAFPDRAGQDGAEKPEPEAPIGGQ